jgi:hypothetical protein
MNTDVKLPVSVVRPEFTGNQLKPFQNNAISPGQTVCETLPPTMKPAEELNGDNGIEGGEPLPMPLPPKLTEWRLQLVGVDWFFQENPSQLNIVPLFPTAHAFPEPIPPVPPLSTYIEFRRTPGILVYSVGLMLRHLPVDACARGMKVNPTKRIATSNVAATHAPLRLLNICTLHILNNQDD